MSCRLVVASWMVVTLVAIGDGTNGPQSTAELIDAYRVAHASGDRQQVSQLVVWVEEVRPELVDPYAGGGSARQLTRRAIEWALSGESTAPMTIEPIETPAEYRDAPITPQPLYWIRIVRHSVSDIDLADASNGPGECSIQLPVILWQGTHHFYGSPYYALETTFGPAATTAHPRRAEEVEIPRYDLAEWQLAALAAK